MQANDEAQAVSPYWAHITNPQQGYKERLIDLLNRYTIEYPGREFIMQPHNAVALVDDLESIGITVIYVGVWCYVPPGTDRKVCCPKGMGGPSRQTPEGLEWFSEYTHLGYEVFGFDQLPHTLDLAHHCNPLIKDYLTHQLLNEPDYNVHIRVSLGLYIPRQWDLFPVNTSGTV